MTVGLSNEAIFSYWIFFFLYGHYFCLDVKPDLLISNVSDVLGSINLDN